ncbi:hypothetical protein CTI12_AA189780 [Artemisia annua]|uniref:Helitron helicase-like domain-containing protein n=1 Tax=Artemisia annua TaxID=35608 RepID=A0A2U1P5Y9_ARTAN|nr:hypothetical protein CTI12_AA189780 [Artemisia annua]
MFVIIDGGDTIDLSIRQGGRRPVQQIGVQTVEQFQKRKPGRQPMTHTMNQPSDHSRLLPTQGTLLQPRGQYVYCDPVQDNQMALRPRGRPRNDSTKNSKQPIYAGDIQSDVHSSKRKSERLKQKTKLSRLKISQGGFVKPTWVGDENDPRTNAFVGISRDYIDHGNPIYKCGDCNALLWHSESMVGSTHTVNGSYSLCCGRGKVMLTNEIVNPPPLLLDLISGNNPKSNSFIDNIRRYNSMFAFTSIGAKQDNTVNKGYGPYCYRIQGENYHQMAYYSLCIYNNDETTTSGTSVLDHELTVELRDMLDSINPLVAQFRMAGEQFVSAKNRSKLKLRLIGQKDSGNSGSDVSLDCVII